MISLFLSLTSCTGVPKGISPVDNFNLPKYLGTWYEIARLDHSFEKDLTHVTAEYSTTENSGLKVLNTGYNSIKKKWETAEGRAYFVNDNTQGHLKVSFFGPFYGSYVIFKIDEHNYQYAFVTSYKKDFLWLLARTPKIDNEVKNDFIKTASNLGFDTNKLIFVSHN